MRSGAAHIIYMGWGRLRQTHKNIAKMRLLLHILLS